MTFAGEDGGDVDSATFETRVLRHNALAISPQMNGEVPFLPVVVSAKAAVEAARHLTSGTGEVDVAYHSVFTQNGFDGGANKGELLLQLATPLGLSFSAQSDTSGGFLAPNMNIVALSRKLGPVGGETVIMGAGAAMDVASGNFDPKKFFFNPDLLNAAKVFDKAGVVLADVTTPNLDNLATSVGDLANALGNAPAALTGPAATAIPASFTKQLTTTCAQLKSTLASAAGTIHDLVAAYHTGEELIKNLAVKFDWRTSLQPFPSATANIFRPRGGLVLSVEMRAKAQGSKPAGLDLLASIEGFDLNLVAGVVTFVSLHFKHLQFSIEAGKKPDIDVQFDKTKDGGIEFKGPLSFINMLKSIIPFDGFSDPPALTVSMSGIEGNFSLPIPSLSIGVSSLANISISAGFKIPFIGDPLSVNFDFCTRENPFQLTVMRLGGGGFFGITLFPDSVHIVEASFEFGAALGVDFGVASGSVGIMAGVYFKLEDGAVTLTGYLRIRGEVDVLGLITASIELYMELTYESSAGKVIGRATLTIEVHLIFFSIGVTLSCEKKFGRLQRRPHVRRRDVALRLRRHAARGAALRRLRRWLRPLGRIRRRLRRLPSPIGLVDRSRPIATRPLAGLPPSSESIRMTTPMLRTALPNGVDAKYVYFSVFVSPRLSGGATLAEFPFYSSALAGVPVETSTNWANVVPFLATQVTFGPALTLQAERLTTANSARAWSNRCRSAR